jgi:hypothetical protein
MKEITTVLSVLGAAGCWYFVVAYHVTTGGDWRHNPFGQHLMAYTANMGLLLTLIVTARIWPNYPGRQVVTLVLFACLVLQVWWRCVLLHRAQRD